MSKTYRNLPKSMSIETRKTRLLMYLYHRIQEEHPLHTWIEELDAIDDVIYNNQDGMKEWTITEDGVMHWWGNDIPT